MKCPRCQQENPDEAKFCIECGHPIEFQCPKCGAKTPKTGKFCMECGYNLTQPSEPLPKELSFDEKLEKIQKYLPGGLRNIGEILMHIDDRHMNDAEQWIKKAIEADEMNDMRWCLGKDYALYADLFKRKGDQSKAKENLNKAIEILKDCGAEGWVVKYEKELTAFS